MYHVTVTFKSGAQQSFTVKDWTTKKSPLSGLQSVEWSTGGGGVEPHFIHLSEVVCIAVSKSDDK